MNLEGKTVLVTGGSRGIGAGIARTLAMAGARVAITFSSRPDAAEEVLKSLPGHNNHLSLQLDVANEDSVHRCIDELMRTFERLDGVVNNAGVTRDQLLLRMKTEDFDQVINTNLRGTYLITKNVMKPMIKARGGSIVNITSVIGHSGNAGQANYAASKAGTEGFTRSVAQEVASRGIRLNCVAPGFIVTDMTGALDDKQKGQILDSIPMRRLGQTEDVAQAVLFLLSDSSSYMTGQTLHVNGGMYM
ncbi:MAG: 3-oxoacyl-[acyl-carrier-protein] reductase [Bdellovibrionales bacterium]|nr:3-oxoacyl-[acyl-carrier-protein] reductase [Bdellovibrionales bacterium]